MRLAPLSKVELWSFRDRQAWSWWNDQWNLREAYLSLKFSQGNEKAKGVILANPSCWSGWQWQMRPCIFHGVNLSRQPAPQDDWSTDTFIFILLGHLSQLAKLGHLHSPDKPITKQSHGTFPTFSFSVPLFWRLVAIGPYFIRLRGKRENTGWPQCCILQ